jgi:hypothetical protein
MHTAVKEGIARMQMQRATALNARKEAPVGHTITVHGQNPRVNINSVDNSVNVVRQDSQFSELRKAIESSVSDGIKRATILERLAELERAPDKKSGAERYAAFMAVVADHMTVILPFLPLLHDHIAKLFGG